MPTDTPRISAVIPAFNSEATIARAIESVLAQTHPISEVLVVDDGSTDGTAAVIEQFIPRVRLLRQPNGGPSVARNRGADAAQGEWIGFLDADDAWLPDKLERQAPLLHETDVGIVHCHIVDEMDIYRYTSELAFEQMWQLNMLGTSTVLLRKSTWEQTGGFDEDRALMGVEDYNLWLRVLAQGWRISLLPEDLVEYTPAGDNLSSQTDRVLRAELLNVDKVAQIVGLAETEVHRKQSQIYAEYGQTFLHQRDLRQARKCLASALVRQRSAGAFKHWCATFVPASVLNWRRNRVAAT